MSEETDEALMLWFQRSGDLGAFDALYQRYRGPLMSFALKLSGDRGIAEEVSQQTWLQLLEAAERGKFRRGRTASFKAYLYSMARNRFIDDYHRRFDSARTDAVPDPDGVTSLQRADGDEAFDGAAADQRRSLLLGALAALPLEQREVMAMWSLGMSAEEVSSITGAPRNTVLSRKRYALKKLKEALTTAGWSGADRGGD